MPANAKIMEALARIEHKLDLLLKIDQIRNMKEGVRGLADKIRLAAVADASHTCPVCEKTVEYQVDINDSVVVRKCGCSTGKIALDMGAFAPPVSPAKKKETEDERREEDRNDTDGRSQRSGRR